MVAKDGCLPLRSVAVFGQLSSIQPELTGIALAMEDCPGEDVLNILTDSLGAMKLLKSIQRKDFTLELYRHPVRQLLLHMVRLLNLRMEAEHDTLHKGTCAPRRILSSLMKQLTPWLRRQGSVTQITL